MARLRSGRFPARGRSWRRTGWEPGPGDGTLQSISSNTTTILGSGIELLTDGSTVGRIRGSIIAIVTAGTAATSGFHLTYGIGIVTADAFGVGQSAMPSPSADADWEGWLWWHTTWVGLVTATIADGANAVGAVVRIPIDTKAMRKIDSNETIFLNVQSADEIGTAVVSTAGDTRMLLILP